MHQTLSGLLMAAMLAWPAMAGARNADPDALTEAAFSLVIESRFLSESLGFDAPAGHYYRSAREFQRQAEQLLRDVRDDRSQKRIDDRLGFLQQRFAKLRRDFFNGRVGRYAYEAIRQMRYTREQLAETLFAAERRFGR